MKKIAILILTWCVATNLWAQKNDETTKSLVNADINFSDKASTNGLKNAFSSFTAEDGIIFNPNPTDKKIAEEKLSNSKTRTWHPNFARLSKSRDWGVTAGSYQDKTNKNTYGNYVHIWKSSDKLWKCIINISTEGIKPIKGREPQESFIDQKVTYKPKLLTQKGHEIATEIIVNTEKTLNTLLKTHGVAAFAGFLNDDTRWIFPGMDILMGKNEILAFNYRTIDKINLKTIKADKAYGGDFAYTYGLATIDYKAELRESFNYVFIWERQADANWNIVAQIFTLAER